VGTYHDGLWRERLAARVGGGCCGLIDGWGRSEGVPQRRQNARG
jgi:hypothetical protein